jgi:hypothetical protein
VKFGISAALFAAIALWAATARVSPRVRIAGPVGNGQATSPGSKLGDFLRAKEETPAE